MTFSFVSMNWWQFFLLTFTIYMRHSEAKRLLVSSTNHNYYPPFEFAKYYRCSSTIVHWSVHECFLAVCMSTSHTRVHSHYHPRSHQQQQAASISSSSSLTKPKALASLVWIPSPPILSIVPADHEWTWPETWQ